MGHEANRHYDNYGREQFRVNFAIRPALSKILAKRAGALLKTLVVDEGFGSQDPNDRQRFSEAINTVRSDPIASECRQSSTQRPHIATYHGDSTGYY